MWNLEKIALVIGILGGAAALLASIVALLRKVFPRRKEAFLDVLGTIEAELYAASIDDPDKGQAISKKTLYRIVRQIQFRLRATGTDLLVARVANVVLDGKHVNLSEELPRTDVSAVPEGQEFVLCLDDLPLDMEQRSLDMLKKLGEIRIEYAESRKKPFRGFVDVRFEFPGKNDHDWENNSVPLKLIAKEVKKIKVRK